MIGAGSSLTATAIYQRITGQLAPSDTQLMLSTIRVASRIAKKDPERARSMIMEIKESLLADAEYREQDLNSEINNIIQAENLSRKDFHILKIYYKRKKEIS